MALNITFTNNNSEDDIIKALSKIIAYNISQQNENVEFKLNCNKQNLTKTNKI